MFGSRSPERIGAVLCLVAGGSFALQPVLVRLAFDGGASVASVGAIRFALAAAVFALLARRAITAAPARTLIAPFVLGLTITASKPASSSRRSSGSTSRSRRS